MEEQRKGFGFMSYVHLVILALIYTSPVVFTWKIILVGVTLHYLQLFFIGGCILTKHDASANGNFTAHCLNKIGVHITNARMSFLQNRIIPFLLLTFALLWQVVWFHKQAILTFTVHFNRL
jgi:hypothetical protein